MAKRANRRRRLKEWAGYFLSFILGVLLTVGAYRFLTREKPFSEKDFSQKVFIADQLINSHLYEVGIPKKENLLSRSVSKREGEIAWQLTLLQIQIPRSLPLSLIEERFERSLSRLGHSFSMKSSRSTQSLQLEVKVMDRTTHRLTFLYSKPSTLETRLRPRVAIVIDDLGGKTSVSQELLKWDLPVTFSILPFMPHTKTLALEAERKGKEVILHLPMEPHEYPRIKPGEGALLQKMGEEELRRQLSKGIEAVPHIKGVSNHMGSRLMEDPEKMRMILLELKRRDLFFLDSRTTPETLGLQTAKSLGLKTAERSIFLDHSRNEEDIKGQLEKLSDLALAQGKAIGIGHPHASTIRLLKEMIPKMQGKGIEIVPLSELME
ncbi:MAG: divergent polysaccharide deacetylase family protein [Thermodesulfobacteriota bacterium]